MLVSWFDNSWLAGAPPPLRAMSESMWALHLNHEQHTKLIMFLLIFSGRAHLPTHALHYYVQEDWLIAQKNESMKAPQNRRFCFDLYSCSPWAHLYRWKENNICQSTWAKSEVLIRRSCWGTHCELGEHFKNPLGT